MKIKSNTNYPFPKLTVKYFGSIDDKLGIASITTDLERNLHNFTLPINKLK